MEWLVRLHDAMTYVEKNLTGEIPLEDAARRSSSAYHFQRMFSCVGPLPIVNREQAT